MERRKVDFPHPEGPIKAVTERGGTAIEMLLSACFFPYQNEKSRASMVPPGLTFVRGAELAGDGASAVIQTVR